MPTTILDNETYLEALQRRYAEETKAEKQAEIIRMAREAGFYIEKFGDCYRVCVYEYGSEIDITDELNKFARLATAKLFTYEQVKAHIQAAVLAEREACAKVCLETDVHPDHGDVAGDFLAGHISGCDDCAEAIRARGDK